MNRPSGWRNESYRHYLAAKGIKTKYQKKFPDLVKDFPSENPRVTENFARFRQRSPADFEKNSFRTKHIGGREIVLAKEKNSDKLGVQSVLVPRKNYFASINLDVPTLARLKVRYQQARDNDEDKFTFEGHEFVTNYAKYLIEYGENVHEGKYMARKIVEKKGKLHITKSGEEVIAQARKVEKQIKPFVKESQIVGSIRRMMKHPVDIDIVAVPKAGKEDDLRNNLKRSSSKVYQFGSRKFSGRINGVKTDVILAKSDEFGAAKLTYTGPFGANIYKRKVAKEKGWLLNEKGLFNGKGKRIATSEHQIYNKLGLSYRTPVQRGIPR